MDGGALVGCSPWGREESGTTERLHFHFSLSCIGEGNGNPLQYSCLENPGDGGAWWATVSWAAQSQTGLKRLSGSSSSVQNKGDNSHIASTLVQVLLCLSAIKATGQGRIAPRVSQRISAEECLATPVYATFPGYVQRCKPSTKLARPFMAQDFFSRMS